MTFLDWLVKYSWLYAKGIFYNSSQKCSVEDTVHTVHFMNWISNMFGLSLLDYDDMQ